MIRSRSIDRVGIGRRPRTLALAVTLVLVGPACSFGGAENSAGPTRPALAGGTLHLALVGDKPLKDPTILDPAAPYSPFTNKDTEILRCCLVRTLLSYSGLSTERGEPNPGPISRPRCRNSLGSAHLDIPAQGGVRYAPPLDDVEISAADVVRGIERTAKVRVSDGTYSTYYSVILGYDAFARGETDTIPGLEVVNDHTLAVHLTGVTNDLGYRLALPGSAPIPESPRDPNAPSEWPKGTTRDTAPISSRRDRT